MTQLAGKQKWFLVAISSSMLATNRKPTISKCVSETSLASAAQRELGHSEDPRHQTWRNIIHRSVIQYEPSFMNHENLVTIQLVGISHPENHYLTIINPKYQSLLFLQRSTMFNAAACTSASARLSISHRSRHSCTCSAWEQSRFKSSKQSLGNNN